MKKIILLMSLMLVLALFPVNAVFGDFKEQFIIRGTGQQNSDSCYNEERRTFYYLDDFRRVVFEMDNKHRFTKKEIDLAPQVDTELAVTLACNESSIFVNPFGLSVYVYNIDTGLFQENITGINDGNGMTFNGSTLFIDEFGTIFEHFLNGTATGFSFDSTILESRNNDFDWTGTEFVTVPGDSASGANSTLAQRFDNNGNFISSFNLSIGTNIDLDTNPSISISFNGTHFYIADSNNRVRVWNSSGNLISSPVFLSDAGIIDPRSLTFDGTDYFLVSRARDVIWKTNSTFGNQEIIVDISPQGTNWRSATTIGNNIYAYEQDSDTIFVFSKQGILQFSFDPEPFRDVAGSIRGLQNNGTHLFVNNQFGKGGESKIGIFNASGTYQGINITLAGTGDRFILNPDFTPSTDIIALGGDNDISHAFLLRYNSLGTLQEAINFSDIGVDSSFPLGLDYLSATNEIAIIPSFITVTGVNSNIAVILDGGILSGIPPPPITALAVLPLESSLNLVAMLALFLIILGVLGFTFRLKK